MVALRCEEGWAEGQRFAQPVQPTENIEYRYKTFLFGMQVVKEENDARVGLHEIHLKRNECAEQAAQGEGTTQVVWLLLLLLIFVSYSLLFFSYSLFSATATPNKYQ